MFTESVIARLPEVPVEEDAVAQLFASDARLPAPSLTPPPPAKPNAFWHEPGNTLQGGVPPAGKPMQKPAPAAAAAAMAGAVAQRGATPGAAAPRGAGGAFGEKRPAPQGDSGPARLPAGALGAPVVGDFGLPGAKPARRNSLPAGALREGRTQKQAEQATQAAARAEAAAHQTRTLEGGIEPSGLELDIPPANANARGMSGAPAGRARPQINAVVDKNAMSASIRAGAAAAGSLRASADADAGEGLWGSPSGSPDAASRASVHEAVTTTRALAHGGASLRAGQADDGLALDIDPAGAGLRGSAPLGAGGTLRAGAGAQVSQRAAGQAGPPSLRSHAAGAAEDDRHAAIIEGEESAAEASSFPPGSGDASSLRPKSGKERRAEARRAARRKAAKHLPPPPTAAPKTALDPAKITLLSFAAVLGIGALGIAAAEAGWWELPPRAAAMLGVENARASLSSAKPGEKPHLVMPAEPAKPPVQAPAPEPFAAQPTEPSEAPAQPTAATTAEANTPAADSPVGNEPAVVPPSNANELPSAATANGPPNTANVATNSPSSATAAPAQGVPGAAPAPASPQPLKLKPPPGAVAPYASAAISWSMMPAEETPAPLMIGPAESAILPEPAAPANPAAPTPTGGVPPSAAPAPAPSAPAAPAPEGIAPKTTATVIPENLASATAPGTMPAAVAATPKAVVTLSPTAAPSDGATEVEEFTLDEAMGSGTPGDRAVSAKLVALARTKLKSRDAAGAAEMMLRQVTADPEDHHAMEVLIRAWIAMGRGEDAVSYAELIVKKRPRRAAYRVLEGDARLAAGDPAGAQVAWRVALQLEPENVEAKRRLGMP